MQIRKLEENQRQNVNAFLLLTILICLIYSNTLNSSWHFDDEPNILLNNYLHLTDLDFKPLAKTLFSTSADSDAPKLYRPVSCLTFALNWYFGQDRVIGYHVVNICIHVITSFFLFLVVRQLVTLVTTDGDINASAKKYFVALLTAVLWAAAPIQTQAVTYIVQRMASLAAMFTILSVYSYLTWRIETTGRRNDWLMLCIVFFLLGLGSKENAILLPASIVLMEFSFLKKLSKKENVPTFFTAAIFALLASCVIVYFGFGKNPLNLLSGYEHRSFSLGERMLTEPRIVLMYLSQIFLPVVERLSVVHDVDVSKSLFTPWDTLPSIFIISTAILLSIFFLKKYAIIAFPVLFFFLNHVVESTFIQLELVFEHRNYLPSFFLFLPISFLVAEFLYNSRKILPLKGIVIFICATCFLIISAHATYVRNFTWANEGTLWMDGIRKAQLNPRTAYFLGRWLQENGRYNEAQYYFQRTLQNAGLSPNPKSTQIAALSALGSIPYQMEKYKEALPYLDKCFELDNNNADNLKNRAMTYLHLGLPQKALDDAKRLVVSYPDAPIYQYTAALAAYHAGDLIASQKYMKDALSGLLDNPYAMHLMGLILFKNKNYPASLFFLQQACKLSPDTAGYYISLAIAYRANNESALTDNIINRLLYNYPLIKIRQALHEIQQLDMDQASLEHISEAVNVKVRKNIYFDNDKIFQ